MKRPAWWQGATIVVVLFAACLPPAVRILLGPPGAIVHVRWQQSIDDASRQRLENRFHLSDARPLDEATWRYDLLDPSTENIRALVNDAAVQDTHHIDRPSSSLASSTARTARRLRLDAGDRVVSAADTTAVALVGFSVFLIGLGLAGRADTARDFRFFFRHVSLTCLDRIRRITTTVLGFLTRGIPVVDAGTAGLFRIVFGGAAVMYFATHTVDASWLADTFDLELENRPVAPLVTWLRAHPAAVNLTSWWMLVTGLAFTAGVLTYVTYPLFVSGAIVWGYVATSISTTMIHPTGPFLVALIALLPSRWADRLSVDAWFRRIRGREQAAAPAGRMYGYTLWVPGLALGVGLAAAVWAKLSVPPHWTDWVLNGTVKYHFIRDVAKAPVDWGLQLAGHPSLAVLASLGVIVLEAAVITAAFSRNQWYRLGVGLAAIPLAGGFYLFMGVFWPAWWIQLLALLPWSWIANQRHPAGVLADVSATSSRWLIAAQHVLIVGIIAQQLVSSALRVERVPLFSWYDMYSGTYESPEIWNATRTPTYRLVLSTDRGRVDVTTCDPYPAFIREFAVALEGSPEARAGVWRALQACGQDLTNVREVTLEGDVQVFDWERLTLTKHESAVKLGPLPALGHMMTTSAR